MQQHRAALAAGARPGNLEVVRAMELLYAVGHARSGCRRASPTSATAPPTPPHLPRSARVTARNKDARATLLLGKAALARGLPLEQYAFPTIGMPNYNAIGPAVEQALVYSIARQESTFNQKTVSSAKRDGPDAGDAGGRQIHRQEVQRRPTTRRSFCPIRSTTCSSAPPSSATCWPDFRGSYILAFVGYNAGRGRIRDWVARYGDPRDPKVDPVDWVERIPFSETRNYVQRVMENMQVYRVRFGGGQKLMIEADLRRGAVQ